MAAAPLSRRHPSLPRDEGPDWAESLREKREGVVLDDRRLMIPPEIKHRRFPGEGGDVRHPFAHAPFTRNRNFQTRDARTSVRALLQRAGLRAGALVDRPAVRP